MADQIGLLACVLLTSLALAAALAVLWRGFGRPPHALSWSLAFLGAAAETGITFVQAILPGGLAIVWLDTALALASAAMVVTGAMQRAMRDDAWRWPVTTALPAAFVLFAAMQSIPPLAPLGRAGVFLFAAGMFLAAARALAPAARPPLPAEGLAIVVFALFALLETGLGAAALTPLAHDPALLERVRGPAALAYLVGQTVLSVAAGIAIILLIASDLADRLRTLAAFDPLTGVANRRGFEEAALRAIADARRSRRPLSLAIGDLDHFKAINDTHGHAAGDAALRHVAATLGAGLRGADLVARVGGDEFALLLVDTPGRNAADAVDRLRARIADGRAAGVVDKLTTSFGVAELAASSAGGGETLDDLVARADRALYAAKAAGRDRTSLDG